MARSPEGDVRLGDLYGALGRFVVQFSLVSASMVQAMIEPGHPDARDQASVLFELETKRLIGRWYKTMTSNAHMTSEDRKLLAGTKDEAERLRLVRNHLVHGWWVEEQWSGSVLRLFSLKTSPYVGWPSVPYLLNLADQAAVLADVITDQGGLLKTGPAGQAGLRGKLAVTRGENSVVWRCYGVVWRSSDGRAQDKPSA